MRLNEAWLYSILDRAPTTIFIKDPTGRYLFMNEQCARSLHVDRDAAKGKTDQELLPADQAARSVTNDHKVWKSGRLLVFEEYTTQSDGVHTSLVQKFLLHDPEGHPYALCGIALDITAQKHTEAALRASENNLKRLAQQLERLVDERTHELVQSQERLRAMASELNLTEQKERKRLASELHDHLQQLLVLGKLKLGNGKRLVESLPACVDVIQEADEILSDALTYTRTLITELSPPVLHQHGLVAGLKWLGEYMKRRDQQVTVIVPENTYLELPEDLTVVVFQSVRELLINAAKHAGSKYATVKLDPREDEVQIQVKDEGLGFDVATVSRPPTDGLTSKFGLFSITERMRAAGGAFQIDSKLGQGTIATLRVPLPNRRFTNQTNGALDIAVSGPLDHALTVAAKAEQSVASVLLVDDHAMIRQGLRAVLEAYHDVAVIGEASNGEEAVVAVEQLKPSVVVMDINMPQMNGVDATAAIKARQPDITVIGLSINADAENQLAMAKAGASLLLTKEAAVDTLYAAIHSIMQERKSAP